MTNLDFLIVRALSRARANGTPPPGRALSHQREDLQARLELRCRVQELIERLDRARQHRRMKRRLGQKRSLPTSHLGSRKTRRKILQDSRVQSLK